MNLNATILALSPTDAWLADVAIQSTVLLALVLGANAVFHRHSAARRYLVLLAMALSLPLLFLFSSLVPSWRIVTESGAETLAVKGGGVVEPISVSVERTIIAGLPAAENVIGRTMESSAAAAIVSEALPVEASSSWLMPAIWLVGIGTLWLRLGAGLVSLLLIARRRGQGESGRLNELLVEEASAMGIAKVPSLVRLDECAMPMTWGLRRQVIALPAEADNWPAAKARRVIRHELAHVARRDCATGWLASACLALLWFHPLAWLLRSALARAREAACDDLALQGAGSDERDSYACDLIDIIASHRRTTPFSGMAIALALAMGAGKTRFIKRRLSAILDENRDRRVPSAKMILLGAPLWLALVLAVGTLATLRHVAAAPGDKRDDAIIEPGAPVTRTYNLVVEQLEVLVQKAVRAEAHPDPFAPAQPVPREVLPFDLELAAASARSALISKFGIKIGSGDPVEFTFGNRFELTVKAPRELQKSVAWALDSMLDPAQVQLKLHVLEFDDPRWLAQHLAEKDGGIPRGGIIGPVQFAELKAAIEKRGGALKSMPSVVAKSGQRCKVEMIREFIYPTEYDPPELPKGVLRDADGNVEGVFPVTPANPTAFDVRNVGITWETEPVVREDGSIGIETVVEDVQFLGFVNYGSPINGVVKGLAGERSSITLTDNKIQMPIFSTARISTEFVLSPEKLVVVSGFAAEEDKAIGAALKQNAHDAEKAKVKTEPRKNRLFVIEAKVLEKE